jgi:hypothetical protein
MCSSRKTGSGRTSHFNKRLAKHISQLQFLDEWIIILQHKNNRGYTIIIIGAYSLEEGIKEDTSHFYKQQHKQVNKLGRNTY